jgi:uncharacterized protein (TIGR03382 family)
MLMLGVKLMWLHAMLSASFGDDFESGVLLKPVGVWDAANTIGPTVTEGPSDAGAHRGAYGLRIVDNDSTAGTGFEGSVAVHQSTNFGSSVYLRAWVRQQFTPGGGVFLLNSNLSNTYQGSSELSVNTTTGQLWLSGYRDDSGYDDIPCDGGLGFGQWHLLELSATGIGTPSGGRSAWLDGRLTGQVSTDFTSSTTVFLTAGEYWSDRIVTGILDLDDVRASSAPNATWLDVRGPGNAAAGDCVAFTVQLSDVLGSQALAPYAVAVALSGPGAFASNGSCSALVSSLTIAAGTSSANGFFKPAAAGNASVSGSHVDFLTGARWSLAVSASTDGGSDAGPGNDAGPGRDAGVDGGVPDAGARDGGAGDGGATDGGASDGGATDAGQPDGGAADSGTPDAGAADAGTGLLLQLVLGETQLPAGELSSLMHVKLVDTTHAPVTLDAPLAITLHTSSGRGGFLLRASDNAAQTLMLQVPAGASEAGCYYLDFAEGVATLTVSAPGATGASALLEVGAGQPTGCGCSGAAGLMPLLLASVLVRRRLRRHR